MLLCTGTAQKYKTQAVADELLRHAPGRQAVFVQTHAAVDADITADWQRQLESQGFEVPQMFRLDTEEALERIEHHRPAPPEFTRLVDFLNSELAGRARHRILRANALDLLAWFLDEAQRDINGSLPGVEQIGGSHLRTERARLFDGVRRHLERATARPSRRLARPAVARSNSPLELGPVFSILAIARLRPILAEFRPGIAGPRSGADACRRRHRSRQSRGRPSSPSLDRRQPGLPAPI